MHQTLISRLRPSCGSVLLIFLPPCPKSKPNKNIHVSKNSFFQICSQPAICQACLHTTIPTGLISTKAHFASLCLCILSPLCMWPLDMLYSSGPRGSCTPVCRAWRHVSSHWENPTNASLWPPQFFQRLRTFLFGFYSLRRNWTEFLSGCG